MSKLQDQFRHFMDAHKVRILEEGLKAQERNARQFAREVKRRIPVKSGKLRRSVKVTGPGQMTPAYSRGGARLVPDNTWIVTAGNDRVRYGHIVEFGSKKMAGRKFWWSTLAALKSKFRKRNRDALKRGVK